MSFDIVSEKFFIIHKNVLFCMDLGMGGAVHALTLPVQEPIINLIKAAGSRIHSGRCWERDVKI